MLAKEWYQIGNLSVPSTWLAFLVAAFLTGVALWFLFGRNVSSVFTDYLFYFIITWKLSVLVTDFSISINHPMSILYYAGGTFGVYLGIGVGVIIFLYKHFVKKENRISFGQMVEAYILFYSLFYLFVIIFNKSSLIEIAVGTVLIISFLMWIGFRSRESLVDRVLSFFIMYALVHVLFGSELFAASLISSYLFGLIFLIIGLYKGMWKRHQVSLSLTTLLVSAGVWVVYDNVQSKEGVVETNVVDGERAPNFTAKNVDGEYVQLMDYEGKKVIVNFWATWCPPCKAEMPHMQKYYEDYAEKQNAEILAVNLTSQDKGTQQVQQFVHDYKLDFPILLDEDGTIASMYHIIAIPTTFIIDEKGDIIKEIRGPISTEYLIQQLSE